MYYFEDEYWQKKLTVCGVDEVGRGPLAGPVVTCAVILHENKKYSAIKDSKLLSPAQIKKTYDWLVHNCTYAIALESSQVVDAINIYQATKSSMTKALLHLFALTPAHKLPGLILIDAMPLTLTNTPYQTIEIKSFCKGESMSASIAAASIIAKQTRDDLMRRLDHTFPAYNFKQHKGYGTKEHYDALAARQPSIIHRDSFLRKLYA